jgi:hypothetical protein
MATAGVVQLIDVLEDGGFGQSPCWPALSSDEFCFQASENVSTEALS